MSCQKHKELLERWWSDLLTPKERADLAAQLAGCEACKRELEGSRELWDLMGYMLVPEPSGDMQTQFNAMLETYKVSAEGRKRPQSGGGWASLWDLFLSRPGVAMGFSLLVLLGGIGLGWLLRRPAAAAGAQVAAQNTPGTTQKVLMRDTVYVTQAPRQDAPVAVADHHPATESNSTAGSNPTLETKPSAESKKLDDLTAQVHQMREMMMLSLLQNPAASERIKAVSYTNDIRHADPNIAAALLATLDNDPNVNVRLTTLEALTHYAGDPAVREGLVQSILQQNSPLVQAALADVMLKLQEKRAITPFKKLLEQKDLNETVRTKVEHTIFRLT